MPLKYRADIDGLRAIAVLAVVFFHAGIPGFSGGFIGVDVFFVISGFLITSIILKEITTGKFSVARFYERRIRRIFPALFPVITVTVAIGAFLFDPGTFKAFSTSITPTTFFCSNILFWKESGYFDAASITKPLLHTWSLAVEEQFYIFFPLLLVAINRFSKNRYLQWVVGTGLIACISGLGLNTLIKEMYGSNNIVPRQVVIIFFLLLYIALFPALYNVFNRFSKNKYLPWLLGIALISLVASIYGAYTNQVTTFYLVPTRAWELLFGSLLSLGVIPQLQSNVQRNLVSCTGLGLIVFSVGFYSEATRFPGASALAPVLGASLIIYSGIGGGSSLVSRLLSLKPMVYIGLVSYSLYLWHWPLIVFAKYLIFRELTPLEITGIIFATFVISALSLKFIEQPFRGREPIMPDRKKLFALSAVVMIIASVIGSIIQFQNGMSYRDSEINAIMNDPVWDKADENEKNSAQLREGKLPVRVGINNTSPSFILWGDSHARALIPAISAQANQHGVSGFIATQNSNAPLLGIDGRDGNNMVEMPHAYNDDVISFITIHPEIKTVFLTAIWEWYSKGIHFGKADGRIIQLRDMKNAPVSSSNHALLTIGLTRTVDALIALGRKVVIVSDVPEIGYNALRIYWVSNKIGLPFSNTILPSMAAYRERNKNVYEMLHELSLRRNVTIIYPESLLMDKNGQTIIMANNKLLYRDSHHLSKYGAEFVAPVFDELFKKMANP